MSKRWISIILLILSPFLYLSPLHSLLFFKIHLPVLCLIYFSYESSKLRYLVPLYLGLIPDLFISPIFGVYMLLYFLLFLGIENLNPFKQSPSAASLAILCFVSQLILVIAERLVWIFLSISAISFALGPWLRSAIGTSVLGLIIFSFYPRPLGYHTNIERNRNV